MGDGGAGTAGYRAQADIAILGQDAAATEAAMAAVRAAGHRPVGPLGHAEAMALIEGEGAPRLVILAAGSDEGAKFDPLLAAIERAAGQGRCHGVVTLPTVMIDRVAAAITHPAIEFLCDPAPIELATALALHHAQLRPRSGLPGPGAGLAVREHAHGYQAEPPAIQDSRMMASDFRRVIRARRLRARFFDDVLFADPAWDMLLDLAAARLEGGVVAVSSLCIASAVPPTTALRWIRVMSDLGLLVRSADPIDGRRIFIGLSDDAARSMNGYFAAVKDAGLLA